MSVNDHYIRSAIQQAEEALRCVRAAWSDRTGRTPWLCDAAVYLETSVHKLRKHEAVMHGEESTLATNADLQEVAPRPPWPGKAAEKEGGAS